MVDKDDDKDEGKVGSQAQLSNVPSCLEDCEKFITAGTGHGGRGQGEEIVSWNQIIKDWIYLKLNRVDFNLKTIGARMT